MRTALTGLSVAWGIFMLIMLLGMGAGLQNQVQSNFADDAVNSIWVRPGRTSVPFAGLKPGRKLRFTNDDFEALRRIPGVEHVSGRFYMYGASYTVNHGAKSGSFDVRSVHPGHQYLEKTIITSGRYINEKDIAERRKVAVIGAAIEEFFFGESGEDPIGKSLRVRGIHYKIVGVFIDEGGEGELQKIILPITTAQRAYSAHGQLHHLLFTVGDASVSDSERIQAEVEAMLAKRHKFSPDDPRAIRVRNNLTEFHKISQIFYVINIFLWVVGIGTITASVVGVSNILLISVAERTVEIGVRKALGATPTSIVAMILKESLLVTAVAGYLGLIAGIGLLEFLSSVISDNDYIRNPQVDLSVAIGAVVLLVVSGMLAGFIPARRAASINPIAALRNE
ncbi:MAG: ABC transporter permease [Kofleriaceae bacterium]|nr:ABC transporter permease [Kofleriaceae bacterium]